MDKKVLNIGERQQPFVLAFEQNSALPAWITIFDEMWVQLCGNALYDAIKNHPMICINSNITNKKDFAATMTIENFKGLFLVQESAMFRDYIFALLDTLITQCPVPNPSMKMYATFCSSGSDHLVNCMLELDKGLIMFGGQLE